MAAMKTLYLAATLFTTQARRYEYINTLSTYEQAERYCRDQYYEGPAEIRSAEDNRQLSKIRILDGLNNQAYIGLRVQNSDGTYTDQNTADWLFNSPDGFTVQNDGTCDESVEEYCCFTLSYSIVTEYTATIGMCDVPSAFICDGTSSVHIYHTYCIPLQINK